MLLQKTIKEIVTDAKNGEIFIPEIQREFVWTPTKVKDLVESLWYNYPVGTFLWWTTKAQVEAQREKGEKKGIFWIIDGQQRIVSLCLLLGHKPAWYPPNEWNSLYERCDILVDIHSILQESVSFYLPNPIRKKSSEWISIREILTTDEYAEKAVEIHKTFNKPLSPIIKIFEKFHAILNISIPVIVVDLEPEHAGEVFYRLNAKGTKVKETDIILSNVALYQPGFVRDNIKPFLEDLMLEGFDLDPSVIIKAFLAISGQPIRLSEIDKNFWKNTKKIAEGWNKTKETIIQVVKFLQEKGISSSELIPSGNSLIPLFVMAYKFSLSSCQDFLQPFRFFLLANWDGRYSGAAITTLSQDITTIKETSSMKEACKKLRSTLRIPRGEAIITPEDMLKDYSKEKFLKLMLYLVIFEKEAVDWNTGLKIGYEKSGGILKGFEPNWHHFFPRKVLLERRPKTKNIDALANITIIQEKGHKKLPITSPYQYIKENGIPKDSLKQQFIPLNEDLWLPENYEKFLETRSKSLAEAMTKFLEVW